MPIGTTAALIGSSVLSAGVGLLGSNKAADAQVNATNQANATQLAMFRQNRADMEPWRIGGQQALSAYLYELGVAPRPRAYRPGSLAVKPAGTLAEFAQNIPARATPAQNTPVRMTREGPEFASPTTPATSPRSTMVPGQAYTVGDRTFNTLAAARDFANTERNRRDVGFDYKGFQTSPGYKFLQREGQQQIDRALASRGLFFSGPAAKETARFQTGLLNQEYGTYMNRLAAAAGMGQTQSQSLASLGQNFANNQSQLLQNAGNARASGYLGMANAVNQGLGNLSQTFLLSQMGAFNPPAVVS